MRLSSNKHGSQLATLAMTVMILCQTFFSQTSQAEQVVKTGRNIYQNGTWQTVVTDIGVYISTAKTSLAAYNPMKLPPDTESIFIEYDKIKQRYVKLHIGGNVYPLAGHVHIAWLPSLYIDGAFLGINSNGCIAIVNNNVAGVISDSGIADVVMNKSTLSTYGFYSFENGKLSIDKKEVSSGEQLGFSSKNVRSECRDAQFITREQYQKLKTVLNESDARKLLQQYLAEHLNPLPSLVVVREEPAQILGLDLNTARLVSIEKQNKDKLLCIVEEASL